LEEIVKEIKKVTPRLEAGVKSVASTSAPAKGGIAKTSGDKDEESEAEEEAAAFKKNLKSQMISALAQVKARAPGEHDEPKPQLQFMAYLAGRNSAVIIGRRVGSATKTLLPDLVGGAKGGQFVRGECIFEKNTHTFVLEKVPTGLAKKLAVALLAETGQKYRVRARSIDGSTALDSDTDVDPETVTVGNAAGGQT